MAIHYFELMSLEVFHDYYTSGLSPDFEFKPKSRTAKAMKNHRLMFFPTTNGFKIFQERSDQSTPIISTGSGIELAFEMIAKKKSILNVTNIATPSAGYYHYYEGTTVDGDYQRLSLGSELILDYQGPSTEPEATDREFPETFAGVGMVQNDTAKKYKIDFSSLAPTWRYQIVRDNKFASITVNDAVPSRLTFNSVTTPMGDSPERSALLEGKPSNYEVYEITSNETIAYQQVPLTGLDLDVTELAPSSTTSTVYANLPNPQILQGGPVDPFGSPVHKMVIVL